MLAAAPLAAQQPQMMGHDQSMTDHMRQMEQMMAPMMRAMAFTPDHLLARKDSLTSHHNKSPASPRYVTRRRARTMPLRPKPNPHGRRGAGAQRRGARYGTVKMHFQAAHTAMARRCGRCSPGGPSQSRADRRAACPVDRWASTMMEHSESH